MSRQVFRRRRLAAGAVFLALAAAGIVGVPAVVGWLHGLTGHGPGSLTVPAGLSPLRARIVSLAESQVGYRTDPPTTYCNKYSAYWSSGTADCGNSNTNEEWCADFAAWTWVKAGALVVYQYVNGDLNSSAASFYEWGVDHGTWHPLNSGYQPEPGDVAVYGLDAPRLYADHVAVVIDYTPGQAGPRAVNGDGDQSAFSIVEVRSNEYAADTQPAPAPLSGYVSPTAAD